jgi:hypothetical protein
VAEGARLESVYTGNRIVGSNPTPSARQPWNLFSAGVAPKFYPAAIGFGVRR